MFFTDKELEYIQEIFFDELGATAHSIYNKTTEEIERRENNRYRMNQDYYKKQHELIQKITEDIYAKRF